MGCFFFSFIVFLFIVYKLLVGLKGAIAKETNPDVASMLNQVCLATVVSWCTYPIVYLFPFLKLSGAQAVVGIQLGYCVSDVISKCGVGFLIYNITKKKSEALSSSSSSSALLSKASSLITTFRPGRLGMELNFANGQVIAFELGGQASSNGVQAGWVITHIDGQLYNEALLR